MLQNSSTECNFGYFTTVECSINTLLFFGSIGLTGIIGNLSICIVILSNKSMHTATNCYLFNIAIADIMTLSTGVPVYNVLPMHNEVTCKLRLLMAVGSVYVTMLTVSVLSVERYIAICHPFLASKNQQSSLIRAIKIITGLWLVGFVFALPASLQFTVVHHPEIPSLSMCTVITETGIIVAGLCSFTFYFIPMLVICMMYLQIGLTLRESVKSIRSHNESTHESKQRAPKLIIAVVLAFFVCWTPVTTNRLLIVLSRLGVLSEKVERFTWLYLYAVSDILFYSSSLINPIIYSAMSRKFREAFKVTLLRCCKMNGLSGSSTSSSSNEKIKKRNTASNEIHVYC